MSRIDMEWQCITPTVADSDPYLAWTRKTRWKGHAAAPRSDSRVPLLIELKQAAVDVDSLEIVRKGIVEIPGIYRIPSDGKVSRGTKYCTATVARDRIDELAAMTHEVDRFEFALPVDAGPVSQTSPVSRTEPVGDVVIALIDRGCAFLNRCFRESWLGAGSERSRIVAMWDQSERATGAWKPPAGIGYGRELDGEAINALIAEVRAGKAEEDIYRELGYLVESGGEVADSVHGTHVLDIAAGLVPDRPIASSAKPAEPDAAQKCRLIFVSIPSLAAGDTTGASSGAFLLDGIRYILDRAGPGARIVINMSVGVHGGPHDGSSLIDLALNEILDGNRRANVAVTVAAGNSAVERWSTTDVLRAGEASSRTWRLMPDDTTDSFLEIWWAPLKTPKKESPADIRIQVTPPGGPASGWIALGQAKQLDNADGKPLCRLAHLKRSALGTGRMALLSVAPTAGPRGTARPGRWLIELKNDGQQDAAVDAWIQRDEPPFGTDTPIQSCFDDFGDARAGEGCALNNLACGTRVIAVGAARVSDSRESDYSGRMQEGKQSGRPQVRKDVDLLAIADESKTVFGLFAASVRSGFVCRMGGTSMAAPVAARRLANKLLGRGGPLSSKPLSSDQIKEAFIGVVRRENAATEKNSRDEAARGGNPGVAHRARAAKLRVPLLRP